MVMVLNYAGLELVRALAAVYNNHSTSSGLRNYIKQYLGVQYNAVVELATENGTNIYGRSWLGPPPSEFSASGQIAALSALIAAIPVINDTLPNEAGTSSATSSTATGAAPTSSSKSSTNYPKIVGGVVGGISFILITGIILFFFVRKKHHQNHQLRPFSLISSSQEHSSRTVKGGMPIPNTNREPSNTESLRNGMVMEELSIDTPNERLQYGQWQEDEMPPEYPGSLGGGW
ncbi:hypothetical protein VKT23_016978 [Stygiomarasmius scandens]|uniref:Uncharacterized protein n=1 Tax=Marasmiellus scandens TaxID=2682957 RepID=A0ABR1IXL0_9AGAR